VNKSAKDMGSNNRGQYIRNMTYAAMAGQSGCGSSILVIGSLIFGIWLDANLGTEPAFTLLLTILSVPASLALMVYMVLSSVRRISPPDVDAIKARQAKKEKEQSHWSVEE